MRASEIAEFLGSPLIGKDLEIMGICSLKNPKLNHLAFCTSDESFLISDSITILVNLTYEFTSGSYIPVDNPRLAHALVTREFFIGSYRLIPNGDGFERFHPEPGFPKVHIYDYVEIGEGCYFKPGAVIGGSGFGFEFGEDKIPILRPHVGGVKIGNNVQVGANSVISRGTIDDTIIEDNVKIDDLVHVAHNCHIGENTCIASGTIVGGSVDVGKNCWLGSGCTIKNQVTIGDNVTIGIGAVVVKDVPDNAVLAGIKAQPIQQMRRLASKIEEM